jgi:hypothetical protein
MAAPSGEHVVRGGKTGGLTDMYNYSASDSGAVAGWNKCDDEAGEHGDHFSHAEHTGNAGHPQPGDQT